MVRGSFVTWKTLGADTRQARAEERVAPKMPAVIRGATADTMLIVWSDIRQKNILLLLTSGIPHLGVITEQLYYILFQYYLLFNILYLRYIHLQIMHHLFLY